MVFSRYSLRVFLGNLPYIRQERLLILVLFGKPMSNSSQSELRQEFLGGLRENELVDRLLEHLPENIYFFVKDKRGRFMLSNRTFWHGMGLTGPEEIVGKTDHDFFWALQADAYQQDDARVFAGE